MKSVPCFGRSHKPPKAISPYPSDRAIIELLFICFFRVPQVKESKSIQQFLRWSGSKRKLLPHIRPLMGFDDRGTYYEPFLGSGAVFFALEPSKAVLTDMNADLIVGYRALKDFRDELFGRLLEHQGKHNDCFRNGSEDYYYSVREQGNIAPDLLLTKESLLEKGARFLYLNKAAFNGLWRVNGKSGAMNAPIGSNSLGDQTIVFDIENLKLCSKALSVAEIYHAPYDHPMKRVAAGDRVYCDPPYVPIKQKTNFNGYCLDAFTAGDQVNLAILCEQASDRGARVILSNANTDQTIELYKNQTIDFLQVKRTIAAKAIDRKMAKEILVTF